MSIILALCNFLAFHAGPAKFVAILYAPLLQPARCRFNLTVSIGQSMVASIIARAILRLPRYRSHTSPIADVFTAISLCEVCLRHLVASDPQAIASTRPPSQTVPQGPNHARQFDRDVIHRRRRKPSGPTQTPNYSRTVRWHLRLYARENLSLIHI